MCCERCARAPVKLTCWSAGSAAKHVLGRVPYAWNATSRQLIAPSYSTPGSRIPNCTDLSSIASDSLGSDPTLCSSVLADSPVL